MDIEKLNSQKLRITLYLIPFVIMLLASLSYIFLIFRAFNLTVSLTTILLHCLFLLSLSNLCANLTMEVYLSLLQNGNKSEINSLLYKEKKFLPLRETFFVLIFVGSFILLTQTVNYNNPITSLILLIPPFAIFMNARHFISGRLRYIGGVYFIFSNSFKTVFAYSVNYEGFLCLLTEDGQTIETGINTTDIDFEKLEAEFRQNNLNKTQK